MTPFQAVDALLIAPFRLFPQPVAAFYFGILLLAVASALLGLGGKAVVNRAQRARRQRVDAETERRQDLSAQAARAGNREAYLAQNRMAGEAYGDSMALAAGRGAALLGPGMLVLAWLTWRFEGVSAPGLWEGASAAAVFLPLYVLALWGFFRLPRKLKEGGCL